MGKHKQQEQPDRHLEAPAEANRDKHINFLKEEENSRHDNDSLLTTDDRMLNEGDNPQLDQRERENNKSK